MIVNDAAQQSELASLVDASSSCSPLLAAIRHSIQAPTPTLAFSLARSFRRSGQIDIAIDFIKAYLSSEAPCSQEGEYRYLLRLKINLARYHSELSYPNTLALYQEIILDFTQLLGATDEYTLKVRFDYAQYLSTEGKLAAAVDVRLDTLGDLSGALQISDQNGTVGLVVCQEKTSAEASMRRLVEFVQHLLPRVQDKVVRTRAEGILQQALPPEQKRAAPGQTIKRKRGATDMASTEGLWTSKCLKDGNLYTEKKEGESDKENKTT